MAHTVLPFPSTAPPAARAISLASVGADFVDAVPEADRSLARRVAVGSHRRVARGAFDLRGVTAADGQAPHHVVLLQGVVVRRMVLAGRTSSDLLGAGDLLHFWSGESSVPADATWACAGDGVEIAVLDHRFARAAQKWPQLTNVIVRRLAAQMEDAALHAAIVGLPRAEQRILALVWRCADRWGTVTREGVVVRLDLTHELLGQIVAARRPTVTLALQALDDAGLLRRAGAREWVLAHGSDEALGATPTVRPQSANGADGLVTEMFVLHPEGYDGPSRIERAEP
jgi:CRP-like cAMP-binding protein